MRETKPEKLLEKWENQIFFNYVTSKRCLEKTKLLYFSEVTFHVYEIEIMVSKGTLRGCSVEEMKGPGCPVYGVSPPPTSDRLLHY